MKRNILFLFSSLLFVFASYAQPTDPAGVMLSQPDPRVASIKVIWSDLTTPADVATNEDGFVIVTKNSSSVTVDSARVTSSVTTHTTPSIAPGTYTVTVTAFQGAGPYNYGRTIPAGNSIIISDVNLSIHNLSVDLAQTTNNRAFMIWDNTSSINADGFRIVLTNRSTLQSQTLEYGFGTSTAAIGNLTGSTQYSAYIYAYKGSTNGPSSPTIYFTTKPNAPLPPTLELLKNCPNEILLKINSTDLDKVDGYILQKAYSPNGFGPIFSTRAPYEPYFLDGEEDLNQRVGTVFYRVAAQNVTGMTFSEVFPVTVNKYVAPPAPIGVISDEPTPSAITFRWTNPVTDTQCNTNTIVDIGYRYSVNGGPKVTGGLFPGTNSLVVDGLNMKDTVVFEIWYLSTKGILSQIVTVTARTAGPPDAPINPGLFGYVDSLGNYQVRIFATDNSDDEDGFEFFIGTSPELASLRSVGKTKFRLEKGSDVFFFQTPLEEGVQYYYAIRAFNYLGGGEFTQVLTNDPNNYTKAPNAPYNLKATSGSAGVALTWLDDSSRESYFVIERSADGGATYDSIGTVTRNIVTFTDASASAGAALSYRVRAVNPIGSSAPSKEATVGVSTTTNPGGRVGVYPNPTADAITIEVPSDYFGTTGNIMLVDKNFREVYKAEIKFNANGNQLDLSNFAEGMYNVIISTKDYKFSKKVQRF